LIVCIETNLLPAFSTFVPQANLLGSSLGLYIAYHLERRCRHQREVRILPSACLDPQHDGTQISRLYRPLNISLSSLEEEDDDAGALLLPTHCDRTTRQPQAHINREIRLADVWDEREEVFGVGEESDNEVAGQPAPAPNKWNTDFEDVNHATVR